MILNDIEIRERVLHPEKYDMHMPLIAPFAEKQLQGASYDVMITEEIHVINPAYEVVDIKNQQQIDVLYETVNIDEQGFVLQPGSYALVTLKETFYIPRNMVAHLRPKTRFIRLGLYMSGQHINPDSVCKLNIGVYNCTVNPIRIYPGMSIGQIVFETLSAEPSQEKWYSTKKDANYANDIEFVGAKTGDMFEDLVNDAIDRLLK